MSVEENYTADASDAASASVAANVSDAASTSVVAGRAAAGGASGKMMEKNEKRR